VGNRLAAGFWAEKSAGDQQPGIARLSSSVERLARKYLILHINEKIRRAIRR
jgi:hypothetical protein